MKILPGILFTVFILFSLNKALNAEVEKVDELINLANESFLDGEFEISIDYYSDLINNTPDKWLFYYNRAMLKLMIGDTVSAIIDFTESMLKEPKNPWTIYQLALIDRANSEITTAIKKLLLTVSYDKKHVLALAELATLLGHQGKVNEGLKYAAKAVQYDKASVRAKISLARCLFVGGMQDSAFNFIDEGVLHFPQSDLLKYGFMKALSMQDTVRAEKYAVMYLELYPNGWWRADVIEVFPIMGETDSESLEAFESAVEWLKPGVTYTYKGKWGPFGLGKLVVNIGQLTQIDGQDCYPISYHIRSNPYLLVIKVDDFYKAYVTKDMRRTLRYDMRVRETWWKYDRRCIMDSESGRLIQRVIDDDGRLWIFEQELPDNLLDGTSLLFFTRTLVRDKRSSKVITLVDYNFAWTNIQFTGKKQKVKFDGAKRETWVVTGGADYTGVAGMSGSFKGWFTADEEALPLKAKFKIFIGSVKFYLVDISG